MTGFWARLGQTISQRTTVVIGALVVITAVLALGITRLDFATGQDSFLDEGSDLANDNERYQELFGGENMIVLFTAEDGRTIADLFTPANIAQMVEIEEQLRAEEAVFGVVSPLTALQWTEDLVTSGTASRVLARATERETDPERIAIRQENDLVTTQRALQASLDGQDFENPAWVRFLLFENAGFEIVDGELTAPADEELVIRESLRGFYPNERNALIGVVLPGNASLAQLEEGQDLVEAALEGRSFENMRVTITGTPTFLADINDYLRGGMLALGGLAILLMAIVLIVAFRVRWRLLPLLVVVIGVVWTFSLLGLIGLDLTLVTISGLPILIGIGIDFAIQMHARVEEECVVDHHDAPFAETMRRLGPALLIATIAAVVAFLVMQISKVPMIRDFGVMLAIGIAVLFVVGVTIPLAVLGLRERRSATETVRTDGPIERAVVRLGSLPEIVVLPLIALAVVVPIVGLVLENDFEIESDPINWANQDTDTVRDARFLEANTGFATTLGIFVETTNADSGGIFTDEMGEFVHDFALAAVERHPELAAASSLPTTLSYLIAIPGTTALPPLGIDMLEAYEVAPPDIQRLLVADDANATQVNLRVGPSGLADRAEVFADLEESIIDPGDRALLPDQASATPAGLATVGVGLLENITSNRAAFTYLALLAVLVWLLLRWLSIVKALLALVPVLIAVGLTNILVAVLGITLSPITTVSGPLVIATCAEFTVLILARYLEERERGLEPDEAAQRASARTGRAFFASALTTACGFAVLIFSALPLLSDFGTVVTVNIAVALLSALIVLPPLVLWADRRGLLGSHAPAAVSARRGASVAALTSLVAIAVGIFLAIDATRSDDDDIATAAVAEVGPVATFPPSTTAPATTVAPADDPPGDETPPATTLPPGPPERPDGLVAGTLYDAYVAQGADPGVTRCMTDALLDTTPEADLIALGIANPDGPSEQTVTLIADAADACGMPPDISDAVAVAAGREPTPRDDAPPATTLPPGPPERPDGLVAGTLYDAYVAQGADPGVTRCMTDALLDTTPEADLIALGIANPDGPSEQTVTLIADAADACGMPPDISAAVAANA